MTVTLSDTARKILDAPNIGILATINPDGSPQTSVVWVGRHGDDVVISSQAGRRKTLNLERDPRASLSIFDLADPEQYIEVRGDATVTEDSGRVLAVELAEKYDGTGAGEEDGGAGSSDPIRLGASNLLTFGATGSGTSGTIYLRGPTRQFAVRIYGATGRIRLLEFHRESGTWIER